MKCFLEENKRISFCKTKEIYKYKKNYKVNQKIDFSYKKKIFSCLDCGISYCDNLKKDEIKKFYEVVYNSNFENENIKNLVKNKFLRFNSRFLSQVLYYFQFCKLFSGIKVLEIGSGPQGILPTLKFFQDKINYFYFDQINSGIIHKYGGINIGNFFDPFNYQKKEKFDLIWMSHVMEHITPEELTSTFKKLHETLFPGGKIFIEIPNDIKTRSFGIPHTLFFTEKFLLRYFLNLNFKIISINSINNYNEKKPQNNLQKKNNKKSIMKIFLNIYLIIQKIVPIYFIERFSLKHFIKNKPYTDFPIIRIIISK